MSQEWGLELQNIASEEEACSEVKTLPRLSRSSKCKVLCGGEKVFLAILLVAVGAANLYLHLAFYAHETPVFLILAITTALLALYFAGSVVFVVCSWRKDGVNAESSPKENTADASSDSRSCLQRGWSMYSSVYDVNGKYFLTKMHLSGMFESLYHCYNFVTLYLCSVPLLFSTVLCILLIVGGAVNTYASFIKKSLHGRNLLIVFDMVMDVLMITLPLSFKYYSVELPTSYNEAVQIVGPPTLFFLSKVHDVWSDIHMIDLERIKRAGHHEIHGRLKRVSRKRYSVYRESKKMIEVLQVQQRAFRPCYRYTISIMNFLTVMFLFVTVCFQFTAKLDYSRCQEIYSKEVWEGCKVKIPFCKSHYAPTCDCAVLKLVNYSQKALPPAVSEMSRLAGLYVYSGILESIPDPLYATLVRMFVVDNHLAALPDIIGESKTLLQIDVSNNELELLPDSFSNLKELYVFFVNNNTLRKLPENIGEMNKLSILDLRNNELESLPSSIAAMPRLRSMYVSGNPLCRDKNPPRKNIVNGLCEQQCSDGCRSHQLGDGYCNLRYYMYKRHPNDYNVPAYQGCNVVSCRYDDGDCPSFP